MLWMRLGLGRAGGEVLVDVRSSLLVSLFYFRHAHESYPRVRGVLPNVIKTVRSTLHSEFRRLPGAVCERLLT